MELDASSIFALGLCVVFAGGFVWAEMHSRRLNRSQVVASARPSKPDQPR